MKKNQRGFTLVEILVTITILGIVTLIALPVISTVSNQLNGKKLEVYENTIESGAKIYTDSHDMDLFGYQTVGCVDVYYTTLVSNKVIEELDFSKQNVITDKIFVRVKKVNDNYSYETFMPTADNIGSINFTLCDGTISDSGPRITFTPNGTTKFQKTASTTVKIDDMFGISPNAKISYQWFYTNGTPIGSATTKNFNNSVVDSLSLNVDTPSGLNGKIKLVVTPIDLSNEISMTTTDAVQSNEFKLDNTAPVINIDAYQANGSNKTGGVLKTANNANLEIKEWKQYGYYFDFTRSSDNNAITSENWSWNKSGKSKFSNALDGDSKPYTPITNHTLTGPGVRYGSLKLCDEAGNCNTKTVQVYVSSKFTINYNSSGGSGNVASTTCYYGFDCKLNNNNYSKTGYTFNKWKIDSTEYSAGASVKNLTLENKTFIAYAQWKANTYTIKYDSSGGSGSTSSTTCTYGSNCTLRNNGFSKTGHSFAGWSIKGNNYSAGQNVSNLATGGTITATARWSANTYTIKYDSSGGSGSTSSTTCTYGSNCTLRNNGFSKTGHSFAGWSIKGNNYSAGQVVRNLAASGTVTAYAQWKKITYTITIGNNGSNTAQTLVKTHGQNLRLPKPSRNGYTLVGWNENANAHSAQYGDYYTTDSAKTIYPIWKKNSGYTIYYHRDKGGWFGDWTDGETCYVWNQESSCNVTVDSIPRLNRWSDTSPQYNYDWILSYQGWNWNPGHYWKDFSEGQTISLSSSINLYAVITLTDPNKRFRVNNCSDQQNHSGLTMRECASRGCSVSWVMRDRATYQAASDWLAWSYDDGGYIWIRGHETGDSCYIDTWDWPDKGKVRPDWMRPPTYWKTTTWYGRDRWYDHCACHLGSSNNWNISGWGDCYSNDRWSSAMYLYPI